MALYMDNVTRSVELWLSEWGMKEKCEWRGCTELHRIYAAREALERGIAPSIQAFGRALNRLGVLKRKSGSCGGVLYLTGHIK